MVEDRGGADSRHQTGRRRSVDSRSKVMGALDSAVQRAFNWAEPSGYPVHRTAPQPNFPNSNGPTLSSCEQA